MPNTVLGETRVGDASIRSSGGLPTIEETYVFLVRAENKNVSRFEILRTAGLPIVNQTISSYGLTVCRRKDAVRREEHPELWDVTCGFSSEVQEGQQGGQDGQDNETDPEAWIPIYETKFERLQEVVTKDAAGASVANSSGEAFANGMTRPRMIPIWEFFQFESASLTDEQIIDRNETVNSVEFKGRDAHTLLLTVMSSVRGYYYGAARRLTQYSLKYNKANWKHKRLDVGVTYISDGKREPYLDEEKNVILGGLNGSGAKVAVGDPPATLEFAMFDEINFHSFLRT